MQLHSASCYILVHKRKISIMVTGTDDELVAELILNIVDVTR